MLTKKVKQGIVKAHQKNEDDTGSSFVQVGLLTRKITELTGHLKKNKKDTHSRRGLLKMVAKRRDHLKYLEKNDEKGYKKILKSLNLKK